MTDDRTPEPRTDGARTTPTGDAAGGATGRSDTSPPRRAEPRDWRSGAVPARSSISLRDWTLRDTGRVLALALAAALFLIPAALLVQKRGTESAEAAQQAAGYTPPALSTSASVVHTGPIVAVVGDESAVTAASGVAAADRWPALLSKRLDSDVEIERAVSGGYSTKGTDGLTFVTAAENVPSDAAVVIVIGGSHDSAVAGTALTKAVTQAVAAATGRAPGAAVVLVGPVAGGASTSLRTALAAGASAAGVRWIDPTTAAWLKSMPAKATGLTAADERAVATRLEAVVKQLAS